MGDETFGRITIVTEFDNNVSRFTSDGVGSHNSAVGIDEKTGASQFPMFVFRLNAHHGILSALKDSCDLGRNRVQALLSKEAGCSKQQKDHPSIQSLYPADALKSPTTKDFQH